MKTFCCYCGKEKTGTTTAICELCGRFGKINSEKEESTNKYICVNCKTIFDHLPDKCYYCSHTTFSETHPSNKTDREKAMEWWNELPISPSKKVLSNSYYRREPNSLTGREIEHIWNMEVSWKGANQQIQDFIDISSWSNDASNPKPQVDFEMLKETINSFIKLLDKKSPWSNNIQLFFSLLSQNASFAHKAHKELQRLNK